MRLILQTVLARLVVPKLLRDSGFAQLDAACPEAPLPKPRCDAPRTFNLARLPLTPSAISGLSSPAQLLRRSLPRLSQGLAPVAAGQPRIRDFHEAFRARRTTPVGEVAWCTSADVLTMDGKSNTHHYAPCPPLALYACILCPPGTQRWPRRPSPSSKTTSGAWALHAASRSSARGMRRTFGSRHASPLPGGLR